VNRIQGLFSKLEGRSGGPHFISLEKVLSASVHLHRKDRIFCDGQSSYQRVHANFPTTIGSDTVASPISNVKKHFSTTDWHT
jgi:hypothetical protein